LQLEFFHKTKEMFGTIRTTKKAGLDVVELCSNDNLNRCEIFLHGATITSWIRNGEEQIYVSSRAVFDGVKAIRGGVPLVFPQFGRPDSSMAQHGFVRNSQWQFLGSINGDDTITGFFSINHTSVSTSWPYQFTNIFEVTLSAESLTYTMRIFNNDSKEFPFQALLHTYIRVPKIEDISISGLINWKFLDKVDNNAKKSQNTEEILVDQEVDRVYLGKESQHTGNGAEVQVCIHHRPTNKSYLTSHSYASMGSFDPSMLSSASLATLSNYENAVKNIVSTPVVSDVVVWNAWEAKCKSLDDLDDDAYFHYVCIEPGVVAEQHILPPGHFLSLTQSLF
jgi:glucose-6-phosphate 1-epimerase